MRLFRISILLNTFLNKSNKSKFLKYINIGIFFSIFAISSALITFYIENKIDKLEFSLTEAHIQQKNNKQDLDDFTQIKVLLKSILISDKATTDLYEYTASTILGQYLITVDDLYLPALFIESEGGEMYEEMSGDGFWEEFGQFVSEWFGKNSKENTDYTKALESFNKNIDLFKKDYEKYYDRIFNYNLNVVADEILSKEKSINYYEHEFQKDNEKLEILLLDMFILFEVIEKFFYELSLVYENDISKYNKEIVELSNQESKIILAAFIFQFMVFIIIQYFEVLSIQPNKIKNAKRKFK
tara:strand:- start:1185 stop:2081 length:897 start_codon:yes stop_codon:yes gene_type:complete